MRILIVGAGHVGQTAVRSLFEHHECTVVDVAQSRLDALSQRYDVATVQGNGARRDTLLEGGVANADLLLACTSRDEINIITAILARRLSSARTVVRATEMDYLAAWRAGDLDVDLLVSTAFETADAVARVLGVPGARHADYFADGEVLVLGFDVRDGPGRSLADRPVREPGLPPDSRIVAILRNGRLLAAIGDESIRPRDRLVVMASRDAARAWSRLFSEEEPVHDVALFGAGRTGVAIARVLLARGMTLRVIEPDENQARNAAELLVGARVFCATGLDPDFLRRERIGSARAAVFATGDDSRNLHAAVLAKLGGVSLTLTILEDPASMQAFDAAGVDAAIDPADETAEKMVRFTASERTRQVAMMEDDRFEVLDIEVRPGAALANRALHEVPGATTVIGAIVRDGRVLFPDGDDQLRAGDRVIVLAEPDCVAAVEDAL